MSLRQVLQRLTDEGSGHKWDQSPLKVSRGRAVVRTVRAQCHRMRSCRQCLRESIMEPKLAGAREHGRHLEGIRQAFGSVISETANAGKMMSREVRSSRSRIGAERGWTVRFTCRPSYQPTHFAAVSSRMIHRTDRTSPVSLYAQCEPLHLQATNVMHIVAEYKL